jgi:ABC-type multidrug transport system ATPase subunit
LTVAEHIELIAKIKGYTVGEVRKEVTKMSSYVGLENELDKQARNLSGGMKRRLSVAMALTGGSKIIILDEPTSGLDPFYRRSLWEMIRNFKKSKFLITVVKFKNEI